MSQQEQESRAPISRESPVEVYTLSSESILSTDGIRLDAGYYNPLVIEAKDTLRRSGMNIRELGDLATRIFIPPRFRRIYVGPAEGVPFIQGSHVVHFQPADLKYLSRSAHSDLTPWIVRAGWIFVTCSGTIGRITICPKEWDGWAASQHILRIVADDSRCPTGYLAAFLSSSFGQIQLTANIYGAVVDELTESQAARLLVPIPTNQEDYELVSSIDRRFQAAINLKSSAQQLVQDANRDVEERFFEPEE